MKPTPTVDVLVYRVAGRLAPESEPSTVPEEEPSRKVTTSFPLSVSNSVNRSLRTEFG